MTGHEIYRLIQQTASWADQIGVMVARAESKENIGKKIEITMSEAELKSLERVLIEAENLLQKVEFNIGPADDWQRNRIADPLTPHEWEEWLYYVRRKKKEGKT